MSTPCIEQGTNRARTCHVIKVERSFTSMKFIRRSLERAAMHAAYCHACGVLSCMWRTVMHVAYCHACGLLSCMWRTVMHVAYCHVCGVLSCMRLTVMHVAYWHACGLLSCMDLGLVGLVYEITESAAHTRQLLQQFDEARKNTSRLHGTGLTTRTASA